VTSTDDELPGLLEVMGRVRTRAGGEAAVTPWCSC
jgi:hypothetical protein